MSVENTVVVPAYQERNNIKPLTERLFAALGNDGSSKTELIFVDDNSNDGSVEEVEKLSKKGYNVGIIVRKTERGLSSAVLRGFYEAKGEYLLCMDADLQHPPESVPKMLDALRTNAFVLGTRYAPGVGIDKDWPFYRRVISSGARVLARPLTTASDPMTGFFGLQKKYLLKSNRDQINPKGFKIALDLLVKLPLPATNAIAEIPFSFGVRTEGESKLSSKVIVQYVRQLEELYVFKFGVFNLGFLLMVAILGSLYLAYHLAQFIL